MNPLIKLKTIAQPLLIAVSFACFGLSPTARALLPSPAPDGGYPGGNTAEGINALHDVNTAVGINNTAVGLNALTNDTTGGYNVGIGFGALASNTTGQQNTAIGTQALTNNTANFNLAIGFRALFFNTTGKHLTGIGAAALRNNTTASYNTAIGTEALRENTTGENNTATGEGALYSNTIGHGNTADGGHALGNNTTGNGNTAVGYGAGENVQTFTTGSSNTLVGYFAGDNVSTANNVICVGSNVVGENVSNTTWIGNVYGFTTQNAMTAPVIVSADGQLGTVVSSERFKKNISTMETASETILSLRPVTFHYKTDTKGTPQFGLIAEEVAKVNPALVLRDKEGKPYTVRYDQVNAMLLNEFLKARHQIDEQQKQIDALTARRRQSRK